VLVFVLLHISVLAYSASFCVLHSIEIIHSSKSFHSPLVDIASQSCDIG